jgi:hypothetical protein
MVRISFAIYRTGFIGDAKAILRLPNKPYERCCPLMNLKFIFLCLLGMFLAGEFMW